jgi:hypothetical protein
MRDCQKTTVTVSSRRNNFALAMVEISSLEDRKLVVTLLDPVRSFAAGTAPIAPLADLNPENEEAVEKRFEDGRERMVSGNGDQATNWSSSPRGANNYSHTQSQGIAKQAE